MSRGHRSFGLASSEKAIKNLMIRCDTLRNIKGDKIKQIAMKGTHIVIQFNDGTLWTNRPAPKQGVYYGFGEWPWFTDLFQLLVSLGVIKQSVVDRHIKLVKKDREAKQLKDDVREFRELQARYGERLTKLRNATTE